VAAVPVPERLAVCVPGLSETLSVPLSVPAAVGAKVTVIVQLDSLASVLPQLLVSLKLLALAPVIVRLVMLKDLLPLLLLKVTVLAALVVPTAWLPKVRLLVERLARCEEPHWEKPLQGVKKMARAEMAAKKVVTRARFVP
jgi:hypothetical protein